MRNTIRIVSVILALLTMAGFASVTQISAQTPEPVENAYDLFTSLDGIESGVVRTFSAEPTDLSETASPDAAAMASPVTGGAISRVTTVIVQLDTDASAVSAMTKIQTEIQGHSAATSFVVGDLGTKKAAFTLEDASGVSTSSAVVVQDGNQVIVVITEGADTNTETLTIDLARSIVETEAGTGDPQFSEDGTSTGGQWDRLPAADEASLADLPTVEDVDLIPA